MHYLLAATSTSSKGNPYLFPIIIIALFALLYFVMIRPQRNKQRQAQAMQSRVQPGQRVRTTAGMYATVVDADDTDVVLEVAPGVQLRFLRRAVMDVLPDEDGTAATDTVSPEQAESAAGHQNGSAPDSSADSSPADHTASGEHKAD